LALVELSADFTAEQLAGAGPSGAATLGSAPLSSGDLRPARCPHVDRRARAELRASGETLARGSDGDEQLRPQELQIALLVTKGRTHAEVSRTLFLSTRTVEFHLSRTYRKLGVTSRTELTRRLVGAGTSPG
jgi:DNA-binding NarL/FixJ family response regulator